jgi:hypothetical protein
MAKKVVEDKVELKTPFVKKEEEVLKSYGKDLEHSIITTSDLITINNEEIALDDIQFNVEKSDSETIFKMIDSLQTIEMGKLELAKELIKNSQYLEAITLLKSIQTLEHGKMAEIISKL